MYIVCLHSHIPHRVRSGGRELRSGGGAARSGLGMLKSGAAGAGSGSPQEPAVRVRSTPKANEASAR